LINDQTTTGQSSNQGQINQTVSARELNQKIDNLVRTTSVVSDEVGLADQQVRTTNATITALNSKLSSAQALPESNPGKTALIQQIQQSIAAQTEIRTNFENSYTAKNQELNNLTQQLSALRTERDRAG